MVIFIILSWSTNLCNICFLVRLYAWDVSLGFKSPIILQHMGSIALAYMERVVGLGWKFDRLDLRGSTIVGTQTEGDIPADIYLCCSNDKERAS